MRELCSYQRVHSRFNGSEGKWRDSRSRLNMADQEQDELFENMSFESYNIGAACKTFGSWNLHTTLPKDMDFFIFLSLTSGLVGLRRQTNYNAGNTFEDALARFRVASGENAVSLDLGAMIDDGLLAESPELLKRVLAYEALNPVSRQHFYARYS